MDGRIHTAAAAFASVLGLCASGGETPPASTAEAAREPAPSAPAQEGLASYYGPEFAGEETASGEPHRPEALTAASRTLPLGAEAKVTNIETGRSVAVEVNDRGPYAKGRILDVSKRAAEALGMKDEGVAPVVVQPLDGETKTKKAAR